MTGRRVKNASPAGSTARITSLVARLDPSVTRPSSSPRPTTAARDAGCHRQGDTEVEVNGRSAVVTPYDILRTGDHGCYDEGKFFEHRTTVVFEEPGTAEIVLVYSTSGANYPEGHKGDGRKVYTVEVAEAG